MSTNAFSIRRANARIVVLCSALLIGAIVLIAREHRPSFLRPGLQLNAYVATSDGSLTVVDLVRLRAIHRIPIGPTLSGVREHPTRPEIWGVSSQGGYVWIVDARSNQRSATIPVGAQPYAIDFSGDGTGAYTTSAGSDMLLAIDCQSRSIVGRAHTGREPVLARLTPDEKTLLVLNHRDATLGIHDAATLAQRGIVPVVAQPDEVVVLPDSSTAFVLSRNEPRISVVDLRRNLLLSNLQVAGKPSDMLLKRDGGELYVISPDSHGLQVINTWTHEVGDYVMLGDSPTHGILSADANLLYITDAAAGRVTAVDINNRRMIRRATGSELLISVGQSPSEARFDPAENLLLVVNHDSGDLAVIRARIDSQSLLTMIPVGDHPQDLAVKLF
jgi:DNA-binding beta-propeller fold protein YncE